MVCVPWELVKRVPNKGKPQGLSTRGAPQLPQIPVQCESNSLMVPEMSRMYRIKVHSPQCLRQPSR
ncbi:hypothetical protein E2C01_049710 [Portunus trituberculatus]|uniref:Uncharacterized protein n=1 Tax=Portunus trituberculatus TaxID=210409 RepID=A0A5B7GDX5_PORTR|nr:hypothetical protein [Portunus trituberculatus]